MGSGAAGVRTARPPSRLSRKALLIAGTLDRSDKLETHRLCAKIIQQKETYGHWGLPITGRTGAWDTAQGRDYGRTPLGDTDVDPGLANKTYNLWNGTFTLQGCWQVQMETK